MLIVSYYRWIALNYLDAAFGLLKSYHFTYETPYGAVQYIFFYHLRFSPRRKQQSKYYVFVVKMSKMLYVFYRSFRHKYSSLQQKASSPWSK